MKYLSFLIKPASSLCNLRCTYCFYHDVSSRREVASHGIMSETTMRLLIDRAFDAIDPDGVITFAFQGGEPTVAGIDYFENFTSYVSSRKTTQTVYYSLQTNGTLLNDRWAGLFAREHFLVGVSLDGYESNTNYYRKDADGKGAYSKIMEGIACLKRHRVDYNILTVLTDRLSKHADAYYRFIKSQKFDHIQCIPCLGDLDHKGGIQLKPENYFKFYKELYFLWLEDYLAGSYTSITLFDNLLVMLCDRPPQQCGMLGFCSPQLVIESDGGVYPCDFYVIDKYFCGNITTDSIETIINNKNMQTFLKEEKFLPEICKTCPFWNICRGGCKRQNIVYLTENYCGHRELLTALYPTMSRIAERMKHSF